jgi:hypothetical protein
MNWQLKSIAINVNFAEFDRCLWLQKIKTCSSEIHWAVKERNHMVHALSWLVPQSHGGLHGTLVTTVL